MLPGLERLDVELKTTARSHSSSSPYILLPFIIYKYHLRHGLSATYYRRTELNDDHIRLRFHPNHPGKTRPIASPPCTASHLFRLPHVRLGSAECIPFLPRAANPSQAWPPLCACRRGLVCRVRKADEMGHHVVVPAGTHHRLHQRLQRRGRGPSPSDQDLLRRWRGAVYPALLLRRLFDDVECAHFEQAQYW